MPQVMFNETKKRSRKGDQEAAHENGRKKVSVKT